MSRRDVFILKRRFYWVRFFQFLFLFFLIMPTGDCSELRNVNAISDSAARSIEDVYAIEKKGVVYKFSKEDPENTHFILNLFSGWENDTFDAFEKVKDEQGIAIDIGAWIGATAIWLSKNFHQVIAIEADKNSLESIAKHLKASGCSNVTICPHPIADIHKDVIFCPRREVLNGSISCIKSPSDHSQNYVVKSLTFKQILFDYIYCNNSINSKKIAFIKCDIKGGEEDILEDVLHFAYYNKVPVYMTFHLDQWKSKKINEFEYLLKFFFGDCSSDNLCAYISTHPFCSLLLTPKEDAGILVKNNMTAVLIGYNQPTYIKNMVSQLEKYTKDIVIIDNNSVSGSLLDYYANCFKYTLLRMSSNLGHTVYQTDSVQKLVGDIYLLTDPDLQFNQNLPEHFIQELVNISSHFESSRVGFALLIDAEDIRSDVTFREQSIQEWESAFWINPLFYPPEPNLELYEANVDTTFCLINKRHHTPHVRVAGDYTCKHLPWHVNFKDFLEDGEYEGYRQNNISSSWFVPN